MNGPASHQPTGKRTEFTTGCIPAPIVIHNPLVMNCMLIASSSQADYRHFKRGNKIAERTMTTKLPTSRSRVTNGSKLLANVDGRSPWARRYRDVYNALVSDAGGADLVSEATMVIFRRAATLATELERIEAGFATKGAADPADLDLFARVSGTLTRLLERVGIERKPRDITPPSIADVIASVVAAKEKNAKPST